jgi:hypothetical protein
VLEGEKQKDKAGVEFEDDEPAEDVEEELEEEEEGGVCER